MKRAGADFPIRQGQPFTIQESAHIPADASDAASQPWAELTIEALRQLPLPPFPDDVDITTCDDVARIARTGWDEDDSSPALPQLLRFCTRHACADALLWFLLQSDSITFTPMESGLDPQQVRYLIACLDRLPAPVRLIFEDTSDWPEKCWHAFIDALPSSRGIREIDDGWRSYSEHELARLFAAIEDHPVLCELSIGSSMATAIALNAYLPRTSTLRKLSIVNKNDDNGAPAPDFSTGLLSSRSLTRIELYNWLITPAMAHALAAPDNALTEVRLGSCDFAPGAMTAFASALANNDRMSSVHIPYYREATSDLKPIYSVLQSHRSLVSLQISGDKEPFGDTAFLWKMLQANLTLCEFKLPMWCCRPWPNEDSSLWSLLPHIRQRLAENRELPVFGSQYFMAKLALSILPVNLPCLPSEVSARIARLLLRTDASGLPSYRTLHMLALHEAVKSQDMPRFPSDLDLASHPRAQRLALSGKQALPLPPDVMRSIALLCIRHRATDALNWLVVHASRGDLDLRGSQFKPAEIGWLIHWTRAAPCYIKLRLDQVALTGQDIADIAQQLCSNHALTTLSLKDCAMSTTDLALLSDALMSNTALHALLLSEDLIASPELFSAMPPSPAQLPEDHSQSSDQAGNEVLASLQPTPPSALQVHSPGLPALASGRQAPYLPQSPSGMATDQLPETDPYQLEETDLDIDGLLAQLHAAGAENTLPAEEPYPPSTLSLHLFDSPRPNDALQVPGVLAAPTTAPSARGAQNDRNENDVQEERLNNSDKITSFLPTPVSFAGEPDGHRHPMPKAHSLAMIGFALRRNARLRDGEKAPDALFVDLEFLHAMARSQHAI